MKLFEQYYFGDKFCVLFCKRSQGQREKQTTVQARLMGTHKPRETDVSLTALTPHRPREEILKTTRYYYREPRSDK